VEPKNNPHGGNNPTKPNPKTFIVISHNANKISTNHNFLQWKATAQALSKIHASIACIQEPYVHWTPTLNTLIQSIFRKQFSKAKLITSSSLQTTLLDYQLGGTVTISLGSSTSQLITIHMDWANGLQLHFVANQTKHCYSSQLIESQPTSHHRVVKGLHTTTYTTSTSRLCQSRPRRDFVTDLITQINQWKQQHYEIFLCMDANKNKSRLGPMQGIGHLLHETGLIDLHQQWQPLCPTLNK